MSLIACPECLGTISDHAEVCPKCGFPKPAESAKEKERKAIQDFHDRFICESPEVKAWRDQPADWVNEQMLARFPGEFVGNILFGVFGIVLIFFDQLNFQITFWIGIFVLLVASIRMASLSNQTRIAANENGVFGVPSSVIQEKEIEYEKVVPLKNDFTSAPNNARKEKSVRPLFCHEEKKSVSLFWFIILIILICAFIYWVIYAMKTSGIPRY